MIDLVRLYLFAFGAFTIAGGVMGFVKAKSRPSLIAGSIAGILLLGSGYLCGTPQFRVGLILGLIVALGLAGRFITAFRKSGKIMPAGVMAVLGVGGVILTVLGLLSRLPPR